MNDIQKELFDFQDLKYRDFQAKLLPNISKETIIGVRNPDVRKVCNKYKKFDNDYFFSSLPHKYYEENNLHGYLISECRDYNRVIELLDNFLPYVDNWATCDIITPKIFKKHPDQLLVNIRRWIKSRDTYTIRFAIRMLMCFYLDDCFKKEYLEIPLKIKSDEYYVNMMISWFYATALAKRYDETIYIFEKHLLDKWNNNKSIQKAIESYRVSLEHKEYLRSLKIK